MKTPHPPQTGINMGLESPDQPDVVQLIADLDAYQAALYPAESNHFVDVSALMQPHVLFAVARDESGRAAGCGAVVLMPAANGAPAYGELKRMYVPPAFRGRGIAGQLLVFLEARTQAAGVHILKLETGISQPEAIGLYERAGYQRGAPYGDYREDPLSLFMSKTLA